MCYTSAYVIYEWYLWKYAFATYVLWEYGLQHTWIGTTDRPCSFSILVPVGKDFFRSCSGLIQLLALSSKYEELTTSSDWMDYVITCWITLISNWRLTGEAQEIFSKVTVLKSEHFNEKDEVHSRLICLGGVPVLWSKWPLASSLLQAIKTCRQACPPGYLMHFS